MKLLGDHRVFRVGAQLRGGQVFEEHRVAHRFRRWRDRIAKTDVHLQRDARTIQLRLQVDSHAAITRLLADHRALDRTRIERDAILHLDPADLAERRHGGVDVVRAEPQQVRIARRPMRLVVPQRKQQRTLEQVVGGMRRDRQPVQQPLQSIVGQRQVEILLRGIGALLQAGPDGGREVAADAVTLSR